MIRQNWQLLAGLSYLLKRPGRKKVNGSDRKGRSPAMRPVLLSEHRNGLEKRMIAKQRKIILS